MKTNAPLVRTLIVMASVLYYATPAPAALVRWTNAISGAYGTGVNWSPNAVPTIADIATVTNGGTAIIADGATYTVSNLWVAAKNINNSTGTVQITSGTLQITANVGTVANNPQIGTGLNALGRITIAGGTLQRWSNTGVNEGFLFIGGGGGRGFLTISNGNAFIDYLRIGCDQNNNPPAGTGQADVYGGLMIVTNMLMLGRDLETGILNITGGEVISMGQKALASNTDDYTTIAGPNGSTGIVSVASGGVFRANAGIRMSHASAVGDVANGTLRLNGGKLVTQRIFQGATTGVGIPKVEFDGGILEAVDSTNAAGFMYVPTTSVSSSNMLVRVKAGGITIDSAGNNLLVTPAFLLDTGSPGGGVTKSNIGILKLLGANTYTGPTLVQGGGLIFGTGSSLSGAVTVNDGSDFGATVSSIGSSATLSTVTLNAGSGTNGLSFDLGGFGNPTVPVISPTTLNVNRTNKVTIAGAGLSIGQFTLVQYTTGSGVTSDQFELVGLPTGVTANLVFLPNLIRLDITDAPSLRWNGNLSADWDTTTTNWINVATPSLYSDGLAVRFTDDAATFPVNLVQPVSPAAVTVSNQANNYTFSGGGLIAGATGLQKQGAGILNLGTLNTYSGNTIVSAGTLQLGASEVIPHGAAKGNVTVNGTLDLNGFTEGINGLSGSGVIDNTSAGVSTLTVGNQGVACTFSGLITDSGGGTLAITKAGNNIFSIFANNDYTGGTRINAGTIQLGNDGVLGFGMLTLDGGAISSDSSTARTITNSVVVISGSTIGSAASTGLLTFTGPIDFFGGTRSLTFESAALFNGGSGNGTMNKLGPATLTLQGAHNWNAEAEVRNGTLIMDGAGVTNSAAFRPDCDIIGGLARLVIGPGSVWLQSVSTANLRAGNDGQPSATNIVDIAGLVLMPTASSTAGKIVLGTGSSFGFVNLLTNGLALIRSVQKGGTGNYCEFNFNGGTLQAIDDSTVFIEGLSNAFVRAGGGTIDSAGFNLTIPQNLLNGGGNGGLTKTGAGNLFLNGANTYTGTTTVSGGGLGGTGTIAGPVQVSSGGAFLPGNSIGTLTINNSLTLQGATTMEISRDGGIVASDRAIGITTLSYGGSLTVTNIGNSALRSGDIYDLFDATTIINSFAPVTLPPLFPGLSWVNNLASNGSLQIIGTLIPPQFSAPVQSGGALVMGGTGGLAGATYYVLTSTNVALPVASWTPVATNTFDGSGNFGFTDPIDSGTSARFYLIQIP